MLSKSFKTRVDHQAPAYDSGFLKRELIFPSAGGLLDSYSNLAYGHVFVNAPMGKVVMLAVEAASGDWTQTLLRIPPIVAGIGRTNPCTPRCCRLVIM